MIKELNYQTRGVCARSIAVSLDDEGCILSVHFSGGCNGNTTGISQLVIGMDAKEAIAKLKGIRCGFKPTSCPDQLALALEHCLSHS